MKIKSNFYFVKLDEAPVTITLINHHPEMTSGGGKNDDGITDLSKEKKKDSEPGIWSRVWNGMKTAAERLWGWFMAAIPTS